MKRRALLHLLLAASAGPIVLPRPGRAQEARAVLVLLELRGGNDGLNTLVPHRDQLYRQARPTLALDGVIPLDAELALHPALAPLLPLWKRQRLGFALGVGWPQPNRSHFKAMDQWAAASPMGEGPGWLARAAEVLPQAGPLLALGPSGCAALEGGARWALQWAAGSLQAQRTPWPDPTAAGTSPILRRLLELEQAGERELQRLQGALKPLPTAVALPRTEIGQQLALALRLIGSGVCPPVLALAQAGYDTHAHQADRHAALLRDLAEALAAFDHGLNALAARPAVSLLTVSEFGRRLQENGSRGTDHGSASVAFLYGDRLPAPMLGHYPSLDQLDSRGDLIANLSPLELYKAVLATAFAVH